MDTLQGTPSGQGPRLTVEPSEPRADDRLILTVHDATSGSAQVDVEVTDAAGNLWCYRAEHELSSRGRVELPDDLPWRAMQFAQPGKAPVIFEACDTWLDHRVTVTVDGTAVATTLRRHWGKDVERGRVEGLGWLLETYRPRAAAGPLPGVIIVPGTQVSSSIRGMAALLASHGYATAVLLYAQAPGLPDDFVQIPVERLGEAMSAFAAQVDVDERRIAVHAASVGVEAALATLVHTDAVAPRAVVLVAPSHVVFQAVRRSGPPVKASPLTRGGEDLPYVPVRSEKLLGQLLKNAIRSRLSRRPRSTALRTRAAFVAGLRSSKAVEKARIPVELVDAPLLVLAGEDDQCWPGADMGRALLERRRLSGSRGVACDELIVYPGAGHFLRPPATPTTVERSDGLVSGGVPLAIAHAQRDAWMRTLAFLAEQTCEGTDRPT